MIMLVLDLGSIHYREATGDIGEVVAGGQYVCPAGDTMRAYSVLGQTQEEAERYLIENNPPRTCWDCMARRNALEELDLPFNEAEHIQNMIKPDWYFDMFLALLDLSPEAMDLVRLTLPNAGTSTTRQVIQGAQALGL